MYVQITLIFVLYIYIYRIKCTLEITRYWIYYYFSFHILAPERIFKVTVDDNDDDDEDDVSEGSGGDGNMTTPAPSTSSSAPQTAPKKWPTEINITCYAAGVHPEPSMSVWVNGV